MFGFRTAGAPELPNGPDELSSRLLLNSLLSNRHMCSGHHFKAQNKLYLNWCQTIHPRHGGTELCPIQPKQPAVSDCLKSTLSRDPVEHLKSVLPIWQRVVQLLHAGGRDEQGIGVVEPQPAQAF